MTDRDRIPAHLQAELDELLTSARAIDGAMAELCERYDRLGEQWDTGVHASLADAAGDLDPDLTRRAGYFELDTLIIAIRMRATVACPDDLYPGMLEHYAIAGWGLDRYVPHNKQVRDTIGYMEECGYLMRVGTSPIDEA